MTSSSSSFTFSNTQKSLQRALKTIPLGSQTFSKSFQQFPENHAPLFLEKGQGGRVWDIDGNEYVDLISGLLPNVLGYQDEDVDFAIREQLKKGITFSLATELEYLVAEKLVDMIPCAEMVRFGKNGTDATSAAIRLARAYTGKEHIIALGYHGWQDWYIGATVRKLGIPEDVCALTSKLPYNNLEAVEKCLLENKDNVAAIILEPMSAEEPQQGYLEGIKELAHKHHAVFIFDEVITGFRFAKGGAQEYFNVIPDLAAFGKGMGNGMPISAVVGKKDIMLLMEDIFYSGTFGGESLSLAAANAVLDKINKEPVIETLWDIGEKIYTRVKLRIEEAELDDIFSLQGKAPWKILNIKDHAHGSKEAIKTLFLKEIISQGLLMAGAHNICYAHDQRDIDKIDKAYQHALSVVQAELKTAELDKRLNIPLIKPVFSVREQPQNNLQKAS